MHRVYCVWQGGCSESGESGLTPDSIRLLHLLNCKPAASCPCVKGGGEALVSRRMDLTLQSFQPLLLLLTQSSSAKPASPGSDVAQNGGKAFQLMQAGQYPIFSRDVG